MRGHTTGRAADPRRTTQSKVVQDSKQGKVELFDELEPKVRQQIRVVGRTLFCFKCDGAKELAAYYCACGSFLCAFHLAEHSCLVSASLQYNTELIQALA